MNHDFDNEFETDDELKRGRSRRKEGRKYPSSGRIGRTSGTDSTGGNKVKKDYAVKENLCDQQTQQSKAVSKVQS